MDNKYISTLEDGFYFFKDHEVPEPDNCSLMHRVNGITWRIGEQSPMLDISWSEAVTFHKIEPPSTSSPDSSTQKSSDG